MPRRFLRSILLVLVGITACAGMPTKYSSQAKAATNLLPAEVEVPEGATTKQPATFRARVYADQDVRRLPFWRKRLEAQLAGVRRYVEQAFGVRLEVDLREWERRAPGEPLEPILEELRVTDPAADVDWVIGVIAPTAVVTTSHHQMGVAAIVGRHFVVRSMNDAMERKSLDASFDALDDAEREELFTARREHKELTVFLHEWAHTLGALHEGGDEWVMNVSYHHHVRGFSPDQAAIVRLGLEIRLAERQKDGRRLAELWQRVATLAQTSQANFYRAEREYLASVARSFAGGRSAAEPRATQDLGDRAEVEAAQADSEAGHHAAAMKRIEALLTKHPTDAWLKKAAVAIYTRAGALTRAEALATAPAERDRLTQRRRFYGLPADAARFGVTVELEPEYVAAFDAAYEAFMAALAQDLRKRSEAALRRFPGAPGFLALACAAELLAERRAAAQARCRKAIDGWDETVLAHFLAGQIEAGEAGRRHLERALELDPSQERIIRPLLK